MILHGKAKDCFEEQIVPLINKLEKRQIVDEKLAIEWIYDSNELIQNVHYMMWFDSVGIYIIVDISFEWGYDIYQEGLVTKSIDSDCGFGSRQEATTEAIKKAVEIFNSL